MFEDKPMIDKYHPNRLERLGILQHLSQDLLGQATAEGVINRVVSAARELVGSNAAVFGNLSEKGDLQVAAISSSPGVFRSSPEETIPLGKGILAILQPNRRTLRIRDQYFPASQVGSHSVGNEVLVARLSCRKEFSFGVIMVLDSLDGVFSSEDEAFLGQLAAMASISLEHVSASIEAEERAAEQEAVLDAIGEGLLVLAPDRTIVRMNPYAREIFGYAPEQDKLLPEDRLKNIRFETQDGHTLGLEEIPGMRALRGETIRGEVLCISRPGRSTWVSMSTAPVWEKETITGAVVTLQDITERVQAEKALRESETRFQRLFHASPALIVLSTLDEGRYVEVNDGYEQILGFPREEVLGWTSVERGIWNREQRDRFRKMLLEHGRIRDVDFQFRHKSGDLRHVLLSAEIIEVAGVQHVLTVATDVTARIRAEQELRESEARLSALFRGSPIAITLLDRDLRYVRINPVAEQLIGHSDEEIRGRSIGEVLPLLSPQIEPRLRKVLQTGEPELNVEISGELPTAPGQITHWISSRFPILDKEGIPLGVAVLTMDITGRKNIEQALRNAQRRIQTILSAAEIGTWEWRVQQDQTSIDRNVARMFDVDFNTADGASFSKFLDRIHPEDRPGVEERINQALENEGLHEQEFRVVQQDGTICWLIGRGSTVFSKTGKPVIFSGVLLDVTERNKAEQALHDEQRRLRAVLDALPVGVVIADRDGTFLERNEIFNTIWGGAPKSTTFDEYGAYQGFWADSGEAITPRNWALARALENGETSVGEIIDIKKFDGSRGTILNSAAPIRDEQEKITGAVVAIQDITQEREVERQASEQAATLQAIMDTIPVGVVVADARSREITYCSQSCTDILGSPAQGTTSSHSLKRYKLLKPDGTVFPPHELPMEKSLREGRPVSNFEIHVQRQDGTIRPVVVNSAPVRNAEGEVSAIVASLTDIATLKQLESDLRNLNLELEERVEQRTRDLDQAKIAAETASSAKSDFLANMSHEIRTPLSGILGLTELILRRDINEELRADLTMLRDSADSMLGLLNDMLDLTRIESGRIEIRPNDFDLVDAVEKLSLIYDLLAQDKSLRFALEFDPSIPRHVHGDQDRIGQILKNLLSNAVKFTERGELTLRVTKKEETETLVTVQFEVTDTGIGIPREKRGEIFQNFTQLDPGYSKKYGGSGLGLAISKQLAEMMGGELGFSSTPGEGSAFVFTVPLEKAGVFREQVRMVLRLEDLPRLDILLAEDNIVNRAVLKRAIAGAAHRIVAVDDGAGVLDALARETFDCILMDVQMPGMDGVEATRRIREGESGINSPTIPIIALTAYAMRGDKEKFLEAGMDGYVSKPVDYSELARVMAEVLRNGK